LVELAVRKSNMSEELFTLLGDLTAEMWYKAAPLCEERSGLAVDAPQSKGPAPTSAAFTGFAVQPPINPAPLTRLTNP
jgi:hypothetical protein